MSIKDLDIKCIIVDDEPLSHNILKKHIVEIPFLKLLATCYNAFEAAEVLKDTKVDIMFLDINMPKLSGISFLRTLDTKPHVILTTAYPEFAIEGFELGVTDYLLKPIPFDRFYKAVNKARKHLEYITKEKPENIKEYIFIRADKRLYKINLDNILFIQSYGDYVKVITQEKKIITHDTLKNVKSQLSENYFIKVHKSYIIPFNKIDFIEGNNINIKGNFIPIGASYKDDVMCKISDVLIKRKK